MVSVNQNLFYEILKKQNIPSIAKLAEISGVHRNSIYPLLNGQSSPCTETFTAICNALNVSPLTLINDTGNEDLNTISETLQICINQNKNLRVNYAFFLYGSRANDKARQFSDYDIGLTGGEFKVGWKDYLDIKEFCSLEFDNLPVKVSLLNFDEAPDSFLYDFDSNLKFICGNKDSFMFFKGSLYERTKKKKIERSN